MNKEERALASLIIGIVMVSLTILGAMASPLPSPGEQVITYLKANPIMIIELVAVILVIIFLIYSHKKAKKK